MRRRGSLFWGSILILLAALLLLRQLNLIAGDPFSYFISLAVIALGLWMVLGYFSQNKKIAGEQVSIPLEGSARATLKINHGAGRLVLHAGAEAGELLHGIFSTGLRTKSRLEADRLEVRMSSPNQGWFFGPGESQDWDVSINREIPLKIKIDSGASSAILDLSQLKIPTLDIHTGASSTDLTLPAENADTHVEIDAGASSFKITIPAGVSASIRVRTGLASVNIDSRFARLDSGFYQSADYATSTNRLDLDIKAGVGSIAIQ